MPDHAAAGRPGRRGRRRRRVAGVATLPLLALLAGCLSVPIDPRHRELRRAPAPRSLPVPVVGVAPSQLRDSYGDPRSGGRRHEGIDVFAPRHTAVVSATEGVVSRVGRNTLGGNVVWVTGPAGWRHYYAHLERWGDVREGQWVETGTVLGYVGNSGNAAATPTHLHYGIYPDHGGAINPYPLLVAGPGPVVAREPGASRPTETGRRPPPEIEDAARREGHRWGRRVLREVLEGVFGND